MRVPSQNISVRFTDSKKSFYQILCNSYLKKFMIAGQEVYSGRLLWESYIAHTYHPARFSQK